MFFLHPIAERGWGDRFPAAHLFQHAALDLFCQIDAVIFVHRFDHRFQQQGELVVAQLFGPLVDEGLALRRIVEVLGRSGVRQDTAARLTAGQPGLTEESI